MGYDNHNAIQNIGSILYILAGTFLLTIISLILHKHSYKCYCWIKLKSLLPIIALVSSLYIILFEGYLEILVSCTLSLNGGVRINKDDNLSYRLSESLPIFLFTVVPGVILFVLFKPKDEIQSRKF